MQTTFWFTGLPCSGKTTLAKALDREFKQNDYCSIHLDGDDVRNTINKDLGFSEEDRSENIRRVSSFAQLLNEKGINVIASFVSPTNKIREIIAGTISHLFIIYVKCSIEECEKRDIKGMYRLAREGKIKNFTGISSLFEEPENYDFIVDTEILGIDKCIKLILQEIDKKGITFSNG
ncbi:MAG: adenylyl-sulfate kinase [Spirochaetes bacterium]|nr:adenylyl-sulfate kinase [Spirochaetota bacterium]